MQLLHKFFYIGLLFTMFRSSVELRAYRFQLRAGHSLVLLPQKSLLLVEILSTSHHVKFSETFRQSSYQNLHTIVRLLRRYWADLQSELFDSKVLYSKHPHWSVWSPCCYSSSGFHEPVEEHLWVLDVQIPRIVTTIMLAVSCHFPSGG